RFPAGADASDPKTGARAKAKAQPGIATSAFAFEFEFEFEFEFDLSSPGYPAGEEGAGNA
ncbi:TPA: hypothetical protein QEL08_003632, partial [Stenotrophomonas maltophilia]|nr:hypothetical protein [Stenotrophomonas maltophilia]